jgi:ribosomal protein S18 acetylase RimI-like enzyme
MEFKEIKTTDEIDCLICLIREIWPEVFIPIIGKEQVDYMLVHYQGKDVISGEIKNGARYFFIEDSSRQIGYLAYSLEEDHLAVSKVYLKKEFRGLGLSSAVFSYFEEIARNEKKEKVLLHVNRNNKRAVQVYLHRGFEIVKTVDIPLGDRFFLNDYWMEKKIPVVQ